MLYRFVYLAETEQLSTTNKSTCYNFFPSFCDKYTQFRENQLNLTCSSKKSVLLCNKITDTLQITRLVAYLRRYSVLYSIYFMGHLLMLIASDCTEILLQSHLLSSWTQNWLAFFSIPLIQFRVWL